LFANQTYINIKRIEVRVSVTRYPRTPPTWTHPCRNWIWSSDSLRCSSDRSHTIVVGI